MDSLSQLVLGSSVAVAVMGRSTAVWKAVVWGGVAGTLPDLDALVDFGDALSNMVLHRAETHGLFYVTLVSPLMAWGVSKLHGEGALFKRWWLALWLALFTHPVLDWFTIYGTQLFQPFSDRPLGLGSMFIVDPLYTLPLLLGVIGVLVKQHAGLRVNQVALGFSCAYLAWSAVAQAHVEGVVREHLAQQGMPHARFFATPAPLTTLLWRVVILTEKGHEEGYWGFFDGSRRLTLEAFDSDASVASAMKVNPHAQRLSAFANGFVTYRKKGEFATVSDLRMGQEPSYVFSFAVARLETPSAQQPTDAAHAKAWEVVVPQAVGFRGDVGKALAWLGPRILGAPLPPPR